MMSVTVHFDLAEAEAVMRKNMEAVEAKAMAAATNDNDREVVRLQVGLREIPLRSTLWQIECLNREISDGTMAVIFGSVIGNALRTMIANVEDPVAFVDATLDALEETLCERGSISSHVDIPAKVGGTA